MRTPPRCTAFRETNTYLIVGDAGNGFVGPAEAFADLSHRFDTFDGMYRPVMLRQGLEELRDMVRGRGGPIPRMLLPVEPVVVVARAA